MNEHTILATWEFNFKIIDNDHHLLNTLDPNVGKMALPCFVQLNFMYLEALSVCSPATFNSESLNFYIFFHIRQNLHSYLHNRNSRFTETKKTVSQLIYIWFKFTIRMFKCFQMKIKRANKKIMCYLFYFKALFIILI